MPAATVLDLAAGILGLLGLNRLGDQEKMSNGLLLRTETLILTNILPEIRYIYHFILCSV